MAIKTYLYRPLSLTAADLDPLLAPSASPVVGDPLPDSQVPITIDEVHKEDLDDAMANFGYVFIAEYTGGTPLVTRTDYGVSAADPSGVTPTNGDMYYNSSLDMEMRYDSIRGKWLSIETATFEFGRSNSVPSGVFFRAKDRQVMSATDGWLAIRSGTVVGFGYTRTNADAASFEITAGGTTLTGGTVATSALTGRVNTLNSDFSFTNVLAVRSGGVNTITNAIGWIRVKWRV
jgi:hypothetical protein